MKSAGQISKYVNSLVPCLVIPMQVQNIEHFKNGGDFKPHVKIIWHASQQEVESKSFFFLNVGLELSFNPTGLSDTGGLPSIVH